MAFLASIKRRAAPGLLLLIALGQLAAAAHALDHGIADQLERCATCVHLDQGSQAPADGKTSSPALASSMEISGIITEPAPRFALGLFDARAPPL